MSDLKILITGSRGFIGKNLNVRLNEMGVHDVLTYNRSDNPDLLATLIEQSDVIVHLAGEMRPVDNSELFTANVGLTENICTIIKNSNKKKMLILASSIQAEQDNPYGLSKSQAEQLVIELSNEPGKSVVVYRFPHVFGKWCKPNYNSVIATFCFNISRGIPIKINNPDAIIKPVYIDDVVSELIRAIYNPVDGFSWGKVSPEYVISIGELAHQIKSFKISRDSFISGRNGGGLVSALYSSYVSYLLPDNFSYDIPVHRDARGSFVEILKTIDAGQLSCFTVPPGVTRDSHYCYAKIEKFLVVSGKARFGFRNIIDNECVEIFTSGDIPKVVETIPGWAHDVTNIGDNDMAIIYWANEMYDENNTDTTAYII